MFRDEHELQHDDDHVDDAAAVVDDTTTIPSPPLADACRRFYVRIAILLVPRTTSCPRTLVDAC
jgi:hypothetical protein